MENLRNQDLTKKQELLVVSFGTSFLETRERTIGATEAFLEEAFPDLEVRRAFTSGMILKKLKERDHLDIDSVPRALDRAARCGVERLVVVPTHLMAGIEYQSVVQTVLSQAVRFEQCTVASPLLAQEADFEALAAAIEGRLAPMMDENDLAVLMGHGTDPATLTKEGSGVSANVVYEKLQNVFNQHARTEENGGHAGRFFIATVEGEPVLEDILPALRERKERGCGRIWLAPLMIVAGDHAVNDLAGEEETSWKQMLIREGFEVRTCLQGLGEYPQVRQLIAAHVRAVLP